MPKTLDHLPARRARRAPRRSSSPRSSRRRDPVAAYVTLDEALPRGLPRSPSDDAGTVPELAVDNPLDTHVLLYDGEELVGAKQNRILNVTVLVAAGASCRSPSPASSRAAGPRARPRWTRPATSRTPTCAAARPRRSPRSRSRAASRRARCGTRCAPRPTRMARRSPTGASRDMFGAHRASLAALEARSRSSRASAARCSRSATTSASTGVSRPDAFAQLWPKLRSRLPARRARAARRAGDAASASAGSSTRSPRRAPARQPSAGLGDDVRLRGDRRDRLRARARRRAAPALGVHERRRGRAGLRPDRAAEPAALTSAVSFAARKVDPAASPAAKLFSASQPPSTVSAMPLTYEPMVAREVERGVGDVGGDAGAALRHRRARAPPRSASSAKYCSVSGVRIRPGQIALTRIPSAREVAGEALRQADDAVLRRRVGRAVREADQAADRGDVDDRAAAGLAHPPRGGLAAVERAAQVDGDHVVPLLGRAACRRRRSRGRRRS